MKSNKLPGILMIIFLCIISYGIISQTVLKTMLSVPLLICISVLAGIILSFLFNHLLIKFANFIHNVNFTKLIMFLFTLTLSCVLGGLIAIPISSLPGWFGHFVPLLVLIAVIIMCSLIFTS